VFQQAFKDGLLRNGDLWLAIVEARNLAAHTYDQARAESLKARIRAEFATAFRELLAKLETLEPS
jgi:nucleotidyltransferase substrate binding protein (TIGR01987 family)